MMQCLQNQERKWLDDIEEKQQQRARGVFTLCFIPVPQPLKEIKRLFRTDDVLILAREPRSLKLVGFCAVERKPQLGWASCDGIYVKPEWRKRGIASAFLEMALEKIKKDGLDSLDLRVSVKNKPAQDLYRKLGFSRTAYMLEKWVA